MSEIIIKANSLTKRYKELVAVDHISFEVMKGTMIGFLGVNGAGKSTTINMMTTVLKPDGGGCEICGYTLGKDDMAIREKIGIVYQQNCLDDMLTVRENLITRGVIHKVSKQEADSRLKELTSILKMEEILDRRYSKLSGGQKRRAEIAAALMHEPDILFLDEPTTGLDPATRLDVWNAIEDIRENKKMTVFLTTHYMEEAAVADNIIVIDHGQIKATGTPVELKERFAKDKIKLYIDETDKERILRELDSEGKGSSRDGASGIAESCGNLTLTNFGIEMEVESTLKAPMILSRICEKYEGLILGTEIILGNMDDVFLNITESVKKMTKEPVQENTKELVQENTKKYTKES